MCIKLYLHKSYISITTLTMSYMKIHGPSMLAIGVDKHTTNKQAAIMTYKIH